MAIDYLLATSCMPQERLGIERLVELHRTRVLTRSMLAHMQADGETRAPSEIAIEMKMRNTAKSWTLQDLIDQAKPLDDVADACATCPAKLPREFACHRRIRYPIPEHVEQWLMSRLPDHLGCTAGALLVRSLGEFGWDGEPTAKLRAAGTTFFESRAPYGVRWQGPDGTIEISSDQMFQMMFLVGHLSPTHALMLALFTGVIAHDTDLHALKDTAGRTRALELANIPTESDPDIEQLAAFLRTLAVAARLETTIFVDG